MSGPGSRGGNDSGAVRRRPGSRPGGANAGPNDGGRNGSRGQAIPRVGAPRPPRATYIVPNYGRRYYSGRGGLGYYYYDPLSWYAGYYGGVGGYYSGYYGSNGGYYGSGPYYGGGAYYGAGPYYGGGYGRYAGPYGWSIGGVRLKVRPRDAEVYVDGYYAGIVDDFDGIWQQLRLDDGGYRIEIRKPGLTTLTFDVRVQPGRKITYHGDMVGTP